MDQSLVTEKKVNIKASEPDGNSIHNDKEWENQIINNIIANMMDNDVSENQTQTYKPEHGEKAYKNAGAEVYTENLLFCNKNLLNYLSDNEPSVSSTDKNRIGDRQNTIIKKRDKKEYSNDDVKDKGKEKTRPQKKRLCKERWEVSKKEICKICKTSIGNKRSDLKNHIKEIHEPITYQAYKAAFTLKQAGIIKRWRKKLAKRNSKKKAINLLLKKIISYSTILSEELMKMNIDLKWLILK